MMLNVKFMYIVLYSVIRIDLKNLWNRDYKKNS